MEVLAIPPWAWAATVTVLAALLGTDLVVSARRGGTVRLPEAALWTAVTIAAALGFGAVLALTVGGAAAGQFYAGWLTEYSLSLDNLFVFVLLIGASTVPRRYHSRVLLLGILIALALRGLLIGLGAAALARFGWVEYVFGAFLLLTAARMALHRGSPGNGTRENAAVRTARRLLPVAAHGEGPRLTVRVAGRRLATPLLILVLAIGMTDLLFALDSIPAVFGLTKDPFLVFSVNLFALLGLRHLYFLVGGLLSRLTHLGAGLAAILAFIGVKLISQALLATGVSRVGPVRVPHISTWFSLAAIAAVITTVTVTSLAADYRARRSVTAQSGAGVPVNAPDAPQRPPA